MHACCQMQILITLCAEQNLSNIVNVLFIF